MYERYKYFAPDDYCIIADNLHGRPSGKSNDELFAGLFEAARILLDEEVEGEDQIIPTLMLAHKAAACVPAVIYDDVDIDFVVNGVAVLKERRLRIRGYKKRHRPPRAVQVELLPHWTNLTADEVAYAYENHIRNGGGHCAGLGGCISYQVHTDIPSIRLQIEERGTRGSNPGYGWPTPPVVGAVARVALEELDQYDPRLSLRLRKRGGSKSPKILILATVTLLLSETVTNKDRTRDTREIYRLLNEHVLRARGGKELFTPGTTTNENRTLWNAVSTLREMLYGPVANEDLNTISSRYPLGVKRKPSEMRGPGPLALWRQGGLWVAGPFSYRVWH